MDQALQKLPFCYVYIDDLLIASPTPDEHTEHLRQVFQRLSDHRIVINPAKCVLGVSELDLLGHRVSANGIRPLEEKVKSIRDFPQPMSVRKLRQFLGLINFDHRFIPNCAAILEPLNRLLSSTGREAHHLPWDEQADTAFTAIKEALANATLLAHPKQHVPTRIMTDASDFTVGAVLQQEIGESWKPIAFFSRKLRPAESRYSTLDRELLVVYLAVKHFRHFVQGRELYVLTSRLHSLSPQPQTNTLPGRHATSTTSPSLPQISGMCEAGKTRQLTHSPGQPSTLLPHHHPRR